MQVYGVTIVDGSVTKSFFMYMEILLYIPHIERDTTTTASCRFINAVADINTP